MESAQVWSQLLPVVDDSTVVALDAAEEALAVDVDVISSVVANVVTWVVVLASLIVMLVLLGLLVVVLAAIVVVVAVMATIVVLVAPPRVVDELVLVAVALLAPTPVPIHPAEPTLHDENDATLGPISHWSPNSR
jgi:hypothetical protein